MLTRILILAVAIAAPARAQNSYTNPVLARPGMHAEVADPFVLKWNGEYFLYTSGDPITAYHSHDLVNWSFIGPVLSSSKDPNAWNQADVWAPEVTYRNGKFYLYYTATKQSDDWRVMERERRVGVAVSDSPRGPFVDSGKALSCEWAIDGHVFRDPDSGEDFFFYSHLDEERLKGAAMAVDRMLSPTQLACKPSLVTAGSEPWEDKDGDPDNGAVRYTNEAPTVVKRAGRYYVLYSGGSWDLPTYALGYAHSGKVMSGDITGPGWTKEVPPILRSTPLVEGPGHNSVAKAPNNVDDINIYHARAVPFLEPWNRMPFVDRLYWHAGRIFTPPPSTGRMTPPDRPAFSGRGPGEARVEQALRTGGKQTVLLKAEPLAHYVFELNLKLLPRSTARGTASGAGAVIFADGKDQLRVGIEQGQIALRGELRGTPVRPQVRDLPPGFVAGALHQLMVVRDGARFQVFLDEARQFTAEFPLAERRGGYGLFTEAQPVEFHYWSVTPFFEDSFETADGWKSASGSWSSAGAAYVQSSASGRHIATKGPAVEDLEFSVSVRLQDAGEKGITGIAAVSDAETVIGGFDHDIWPFARFRVRKYRDGKMTEEIAVPMQRGFRYEQFHEVRLLKQGSALTFWLDGAEIAATRVSAGAVRAGLATDGASARFDNARWKQVVVPHSLLLNGSFETEQWEQSKPAQGNPWQTSGTAREHYCCAHTGLRRLLITAGEGAVRQEIPDLPPGRYTLYAYAITRGEEPAEVAVEGVAAPAKLSVRSERWAPVRLDFSVAGGEAVTVVFRAAPRESGWAAADDFYLEAVAERGTAE